MALSASHCRTNRQRPAPSENRRAISLRRAAPRANCSPATLAQAISSTSATAPISNRMGSPNSARMNEIPMPPGRTSMRCCMAMRLNPDSGCLP